jgi:hypothetical protein
MTAIQHPDHLELAQLRDLRIERLQHGQRCVILRQEQSRNQRLLDESLRRFFKASEKELGL